MCLPIQCEKSLGLCHLACPTATLSLKNSDEFSNLRRVVSKPARGVDKLSRYPDIPESSKKSHISIENLLNPAAESKLVHNSIRMPTEEEIVASMQLEANADTEENQEEQSESEDQPERIPWNLTKMKAALNETEFGLLM
ncbi:hypothetical protein PSTG_14471 [Puccinia striiformis f. sp. tritici PST-78]|uniref:Uncharacterized protein n=1 Tax=Puccinia striiformis f. sp. tritici PST-78 TaxID=1165861 RepID=A0A0L0UYK3_9BASI|nr:hypothetical protein PSTG_14471 [Puccinia striiformis f. sp. tritici PST-78]